MVKKIQVCHHRQKPQLTAAFIISQGNFARNSYVGPTLYNMPQQVTVGTLRKAWWKCPLGHSYSAVSARTISPDWKIQRPCRFYITIFQKKERFHET